MPDGHALAEDYEALREDVVQLGGRSHTVRGRALLMCKGLAAWIKCVGEAPMRSRSPAGPGAQMRLPVGFEQNLVEILATMALATAREVVA